VSNLTSCAKHARYQYHLSVLSAMQERLSRRAPDTSQLSISSGAYVRITPCKQLVSAREKRWEVIAGTGPAAAGFFMHSASGALPAVGPRHGYSGVVPMPIICVSASNRLLANTANSD